MMAARCADGSGNALKRLRCWVWLVVAWLPAVAAPMAQGLDLEQRGDYLVGYQYRSGQTRRLPPGWTGGFDLASGISYRPIGNYKGKAASLLHCPWRGGTGVAFQEFTVQLPHSGPIRLKGATAMQAGAADRSDGATFRVFVNGQRLLSRHQTAVDWDEFDFDLSANAGQSVLIRFETDPGPADKADFDFSLWGDRRIEVAGTSAMAKAPAAMGGELDYSSLQSQAPAAVVPWVGRPAAGRWERAGAAREFRYRDDAGLFNVAVGASAKAEAAFPAVTVSQANPVGAAQALVIPQPVALRWDRAVRLVSAAQRTEGDRVVARHVYADGDGHSATVRSVLRVVNQSLVFEVVCDKPWLAEVGTSGWQPEQERMLVPAPYYSGQIALLPRLGWFAHQFFDWQGSAASSLADGIANYPALTSGRRNTASERIVYAFAARLEEVLPHVPNPRSPFRADVAGRVFLDAWGGSFDSIDKRLSGLAPYGLSNCVLMIHDWQRSGYDNALPAHVPAAASHGGEQAFGRLVASGKRAGCLVAAHENYADLYPNYEGFTQADSSLGSDGQPLKAWFNTGTQVQSLAMRPNAMVKHAAEQATEIARRYGTNATFLDVHSSMPPWFHVDFRASEAGAGTFRQVMNQTALLWRSERAWHGGPVFGEGADHWYWSGQLDGVEAQPGAGWELGEGDAVPLAVGFSLLKLHPLQIDHGMGYYHRWSSRVKGAERPTDGLLDRYRMQEVAFAHAAYLGASTWHSGWDLWLEQNLVPPVVKRAAQSAVSSIHYWVDGRWVSMSAAAQAGVWSAVKVEYGNGLVVFANASSSMLTVEGLAIPPNGWHAQGAGLLAWSASQQGQRNDYAADEAGVFANVLSLSPEGLNRRAKAGEAWPPVTFPTLATNGSVQIRRVGATWQLRTVPGAADMSIRLNADTFGQPEGLQCDRSQGLELPTPAAAQAAWRLSLAGGTTCQWHVR
jgi:hypothetical protein